MAKKRVPKNLGKFDILMEMRAGGDGWKVDVNVNRTFENLGPEEREKLNTLMKDWAQHPFIRYMGDLLQSEYLAKELPMGLKH